MQDESLSLKTAEESVGSVLLRALFEEISNLRTPWAITPKSQQDEVIDRLRAQVSEAVAGAVTRIATQGFAHIAVNIESLTVKDEAKAVLTLSRGVQEIHDLADRVGSRAVLVFADPQEYTDGMHAIQGEDDQPGLGLEEVA